MWMTYAVVIRTEWKMTLSIHRWIRWVMTRTPPAGRRLFSFSFRYDWAYTSLTSSTKTSWKKLWNYRKRWASSVVVLDMQSTSSAFKTTVSSTWIHIFVKPPSMSWKNHSIFPYAEQSSALIRWEMPFVLLLLQSYSCSSPKKLTTRKMDPSCTLGFYCRDKADFEMFCAQVSRNEWERERDGLHSAVKQRLSFETLRSNGDFFSGIVSVIWRPMIDVPVRSFVSNVEH